MKVKIKRIDIELPLPEYKTEGAVGLDLYARVETTIPAKAVAKIPANVIVKTPPNYLFLIASRSSTPFKKGLMPANGVGIGDPDFCGEQDEYHIAVFNYSDNAVVVERGERIAQGIFVPIERVEWQEVNTMSAKSRGGFGSTDK